MTLLENSFCSTVCRVFFGPFIPFLAPPPDVRTCIIEHKAVPYSRFASVMEFKPYSHSISQINDKYTNQVETELCERDTDRILGKTSDYP